MASSTGAPAIDWQFGSPRELCARSQTYHASSLPRRAAYRTLQISAATPTHRAPLQQRRPLSRRRRTRYFISATIGLEDLEVLLKLLPGDVAGMGVRDAGEPVIAFALSQNLLPIGGSPIMAPTIGVGARITRVVQRSDRGRYGQRLENRRRTVAEPRWEEKALACEKP